MKTKQIFYLTLVISLLCTWMNVNYASASSILSVYPSPLSENADVKTVITITFSEEMDSSTINANTFFVKTGVAYGYATISGTITYGNKKATFKPTDSLSYEKEYIATITKDVKNANGSNFLEADYTWRFTTRTEIISVQPPHLSTNVDINTAITVKFSETMNSSTINSNTFFVKTGSGYSNATIPGTITYTNKTATFRPTSSLYHGKEYLVTVTKAIKKADGTSMKSDYTWRFRTEANLSILAGDIDYNEKINLDDAILTLQILARADKTYINLSADVNNDSRIGMEEAIYILQKISGLK